MDNEREHKTSRKKYKSPKSKLINFFEGSRDKWKKKAKDAKYQIKLLRKKIKYIERKEKEYKKHSNNLEMQLKQMKDKEKRMQDEINRLKKNFKSANC